MITLSQAPQLLLDDFLIARMENLTRRLSPVRKEACNPAIESTFPWEKSDAGLSRLYAPCLVKDAPDADSPRLFYTCLSGERSIVCTAVSDDGHNWIKPELTLHPFGDYPRTHIVLMRDEWYEQTGPLWMIENPVPEGMDAAFLSMVITKDARTKRRETHVLSSRSTLDLDMSKKHTLHHPQKNDTAPSIVWCPQDQRFRAYTRAHITNDPDIPYYRGVSVMESADFVHWTHPELLLKTTAPDKEVPDDQIYSMNVTRLADDTYIGLLSMLHVKRREGKIDIGPMDIELWTSRDGISWDRPFPGEAFIPTGEVGTWDAGMTIYASRLLAWEDRWLVAYTGASLLHGQGSPMNIGLAGVAPERLVALESRNPGQMGLLQTKPFHFEGNTLLVNTDAGDGQLAVEILDEKSRVLPEFGAEKSILIPFDSLRKKVGWRSNDGESSPTNPAHLPGRPICLRFYLKGAQLYAFQIVKGED
jgi:hypothetical protein